MRYAYGKSCALAALAKINIFTNTKKHPPLGWARTKTKEPVTAGFFVG